MVEPYVSTPVIAEKAASPLDGHRTIGQFGNLKNGAGVTLTERNSVAIVDVAAWPDGSTKTINAIKRVTGLGVSKTSDDVGNEAQAFQHAPHRWTVIGVDDTLPAQLTKSVGTSGTVVDLSHGRTIIRISGNEAEWVLAKLFAIDFAASAFPVGKGLATKHHEILAQIQRVDETVFDVIIFRSYARAFWHTMTRASEEVGYSVV